MNTADATRGSSRGLFTVKNIFENIVHNLPGLSLVKFSSFWNTQDSKIKTSTQYKELPTWSTSRHARNTLIVVRVTGGCRKLKQTGSVARVYTRP